MTRFSLGGLLSFKAGFFAATGFLVEALVFLAAIFRVNAKKRFILEITENTRKGRISPKYEPIKYHDQRISQISKIKSDALTEKVVCE